MRKRILVPPALRKPRRTGGKNGAPFGNTNAFKHGRFTRERRAFYAAISAHIRQAREILDALR